MASPLSPSPGTLLNFATPPTAQRFDKQEAQSSPLKTEANDPDHDPSSPFASEIIDEKEDTRRNQENVLPSKSRHSRILSGHELSPLKILSSRDENIEAEMRSPGGQAAPPKSARKLFSVKRFPVKVNNGPSPEKPATPETPVVQETPTVQETPIVQEKVMTLEDAMQQNEGLVQAIQIFDDEETTLDKAEEEADVTSMSTDDQEVEDEPAAPDDTMISTFSDFSAIPNMTMFARIGHSPTRFVDAEQTPTARRRGDPTPSRTSRPPVMHESGNTSNLLMDFTEQIQGFSSRHAQPSPSRNGRASPNKPTRNNIGATPQRRQSNLLDFDIPPLPTPRSIPTVTPRELESLKSAFLSEISSLKAALSGKEAEVSSFKTAVGDAEKRVGECMEQLREVRGLKDLLAEEKESWEQRSREMEDVLRNVKEEIVHCHRERDEIESKLDESEKRREAAEIMAQEAESKMAGMRAGRATGDDSNKSPEKGPKSPGSREVEIAVERVARDLHALYKSKHEAKVGALKKSYEHRWEKKVRQLERKIEELMEENEKLSRDATMTKVDPNQTIIDEERKDQAVKDSTQIKELNAEIEKLEAVVNSVEGDNGQLRKLLERERVEKGELVQLAEEMMSMQQSFIKSEEAPSRPAVAKSQVAGENFRSSVGRASGLKAPSSIKKPTASRIATTKTHDRVKSVGPHGGLPRPGSGMSSRSGIMSSIEKMGSYRGRAE